MDTWCCPTPPYTESITNFYPINQKDSINGESPGFSGDSGIRDTNRIKSSLIYRDCGPNTSSRINRFYSLVSQHLDTIYLAPYHPSHFSRVNQHKARRVKNPLLLPSYLEREVINSLSLVHQSDDLILICKSTGSLNSGISLFMIESDLNEDYNVNTFTNYDGFHRVMRYKYNNKIWKFRHKSKVYLKELTGTSTLRRNFRDLDLLELKSDTKNSSKSMIYGRNFYGFAALSVDLDTKIPNIIKTDTYLDKKIYNISVSPYEFGTVSLLTNDSLRIQSFSSNNDAEYNLSLKGINIQTISYGSSPNIILMGSNNLYIKDTRCGGISQAILDNGIKAHISTNSRWSFRRIKNKSVHKDKRYFSVDSCAYSNYYRQSGNIFWDAITAIASHPIHKNIIAFVYGVSDCIYIFDLNMPTLPLYELPISNSVYIGSRCRHIEWVESSGYYKWLLIPFNWRDNIINIFHFDSNITLSTPKHSVIDPKIDVINESKKFPNYSGLFETNSDIAMPILSSESNLLNVIFHGYSGIAFANIDCNLHALVNTTSGRLIDISIDGNLPQECIENSICSYNNDKSQNDGDLPLQSRAISIPDDEFLDKMCDLKVKKRMDYKKRTDIPLNYKFDLLLASNQFTIGINNNKINDFSNNKIVEKYNSIPLNKGYKYFQIDNVCYVTNYSWNRLERAERLNQKCPYAELYNTATGGRQTELNSLDVDLQHMDFSQKLGDVNFNTIDIHNLDKIADEISVNESIYTDKNDIGKSYEQLDLNIVDRITKLCENIC